VPIYAKRSQATMTKYRKNNLWFIRTEALPTVNVPFVINVASTGGHCECFATAIREAGRSVILRQGAPAPAEEDAEYHDQKNGYERSG
jgi:hypothetical protein